MGMGVSKCSSIKDRRSGNISGDNDDVILERDYKRVDILRNMGDKR